jgi:hypothetical protein
MKRTATSHILPVHGEKCLAEVADKHLKLNLSLILLFSSHG